MVSAVEKYNSEEGIELECRDRARVSLNLNLYTLSLSLPPCRFFILDTPPANVITWRYVYEAYDETVITRSNSNIITWSEPDQDWLAYAFETAVVTSFSFFLFFGFGHGQSARGLFDLNMIRILVLPVPGSKTGRHPRPG